MSNFYAKEIIEMAQILDLKLMLKEGHNMLYGWRIISSDNNVIDVNKDGSIARIGNLGKARVFNKWLMETCSFKGMW